MTAQSKIVFSTSILVGSLFFLGIIFPADSFVVAGDELRAPAPNFKPGDTQGVFFPSVTDSLNGPRPDLAGLRRKKATVSNMLPSGGGEVTPAAKGTWNALITATSIEDEIKRMKLHYDSVVTQPGAFKSGGYQEARLDLMVMSSLFAIITQFQGDVRWKEDAAVARDLLGRTAFNCNAGSTQVFNEARARKDDLRDLLTGTGLRRGKAAAENDWASIADRSPMMEYAEQLRESLRLATASAAQVKSEPNDARRPAELLAVLGKILVQEGMDASDEEDYRKLSEAMTDAALQVRRGLELDDYDAITKGVSALTQSCDACHEQYR